MDAIRDKPKRIVVIGAGFGGLHVVRALARAPVTVTVIDRRNFHLFQPLLYQVATASLSPSDIAAPIRSILRDQANATVLLDKVTGIDRDGRRVLTEGGRVIGYDLLVIATGARHSYFGRDEWAMLAPGIKTIDDATQVRAKILLALESAELEQEDVRRQAYLTFVVIGGGPTGVEMAGAIAELVHAAANRDFRMIKPEATRIFLVEAGPRLLATFPESLSAAARRSLEAMGVTVLTNHRVTKVSADGVVTDGLVLEARTIIWAAGVKASPAGHWLQCETDRVGRVKVDERFLLPTDPNIFVIGDTAAYFDGEGRALPGIATAAKQAGKWVGQMILSRVTERAEPKAFRYRDPGVMATIGRKSAVADLGQFHLTGFPAWLLWSLVHIWFLIGFRNRLSVATSWTWSYLTFERGARLITGREIALATAVAETGSPKDAP